MVDAERGASRLGLPRLAPKAIVMRTRSVSGGMSHVSVYVTCPDEETATRIARDLLDKRLVACANVLPRMRSLYRWEGQVRDEPEVAMLLKTRRAVLGEIERAVKALHPYENPCVVAFDLVGGAAAYLAWVDAQTT